MAENIDSIFEQYAAQAEKKAQSPRNSFQQRTYETIKWTGLESGKPKILRAVGTPPDSDNNPTTARNVTIAWVVGDDGKKFKLIRPSVEADPLHIINRIISKVTKSKWVNNVKTFPVKESYPYIYNIVEKNGLEANDPKARFDRGWKGQEVVIMNVIDRAQMDWHRANKHTMLLARSIDEYNGTEFVSEGVSSFSLNSKLPILFRAYGDWEKYDMAITRTGDMNNPLIVTNASHSPMEVTDKNARALISTEPSLTEEEKSWERYDIQKLFKVTSYTKIYNRLKGTIKKIDAALGTDFLSEIEKETEKEKAEWAELYGDEDTTPAVSVTPVTESKPVEHVVEEVRNTPVVEEVPTRSSRSSGKEPWEELPYGNTLSDEYKRAVTEVIKDPETGKIIDVKWNTTAKLVRCDNLDCKIPSPLDITQCPCCGKEF